MATSVSKLLAEMTERLLVCEVCMVDFQSPQRLPRVLPCHHAFCGECLQQLCKDNHLNCPKCRRFIVVEGPFPVETTRMTLLDLKKFTGDQEEQVCDGCSEKVKVTTWCQECEESLCDDCCQAHKLVKATRDHNLVSLDEAAIDPSKLLQLKEKCGKHEDRELEFYCPECQQATCSSCAVIGHNGHKMVELEVVLNKRRDEMKVRCQRLEKVIITLKDNAESSTESFEHLDTRRLEISSEVRALFSKARELLDERENEIMEDLETKIKNTRMALEAQQASDQSLMSEAQASLEFAERVASLGLPSQLLSAPEEMDRTCDSLEERSTTLPDFIPDYEVDCSSLTTLTGAVKTMGEIRAQTGELQWTGTRLMHLELEVTDLTLNDMVQDGYFGKMWKGKWQEEKDVTIYTRAANLTSRESLLVEARIMKSCKHEHVVCLFGICSGVEPMYIVTEFMPHGNLAMYLSEGAGRRAPEAVLIDMAAQIASAMVYLGEKRIVHRDLAARNVLVGNNSLIKIANFRLARVIPEGTDEYVITSGTCTLQVKWTAPEAAAGKFTIKSDVWSYGILLFELMTHGQTPYHDMTLKEAMERVRNGYRMARPKKCPESVYKTMLNCWTQDPKRRPTFEFLHDFFSDYESTNL